MAGKFPTILFAAIVASAIARADAANIGAGVEKPSAIRSIEEGCSDCTEAFQAWLDAGGKVTLAAGTYAVTNTLMLGDGAEIVGEPGRTRIRMNGDGHVFQAAGRLDDGKLVRASGLALCGFAVEAKELRKDRYAISLASVENVLVENVETVGMGGIRVRTVYKVNGFDKTVDPCATAGMVGDECLSSNIVVRACHFDGGRRDMAKGVDVSYATDIAVRDCLAVNLRQGFQFWGGNSSPRSSGLLRNDKRCKRVTVANCRAYNITGGGIWGSMVEDWLVTNCTAQLCFDVGIDFEGCHRAEAVDCVVRDCANGNLATFMWCLGDVAFRRCFSEMTNDRQFTCHYFNSNYTLTPGEQRVTIEDCVFTGARPTLIGVRSALAEFRFVRNRCVNAFLDTHATNMGRVICEDNVFEGAPDNLEEVKYPESKFPKNKRGAPPNDRPPRKDGE